MSNYWDCALLWVVLSRPRVAHCNAISESRSERSVTAIKVLRHWGCALPWGVVVKMLVLRVALEGSCQDAGVVHYFVGSWKVARVVHCFGGILPGLWGVPRFTLAQLCQIPCSGAGVLWNDLVELLRLRIALWSSQAAAGARCFGVMCLRR